MFTTDAINAMVTDRGERLRLEADRARFARHRTRFARSARSRKARRLLPRLLGLLRVGARRVAHLPHVSPFTS